MKLVRAAEKDTHLNRFAMGALLLAAAMMLGGCESTRKFVGIDRDPPDEFAVYSRAPLSLPPEFALRPPAPGTARPQLDMPVDQAKRAIAGRETRPAAPQQSASSDGTSALLRQTGGDRADPQIRATVNRETASLVSEGKTVADSIIFWRKKDDYHVVVDPTKESKRIQENQALGKSLTSGPTPTIDRKQKGLLQF
jgi:hypothetical protein